MLGNRLNNIYQRMLYFVFGVNIDLGVALELNSHVKCIIGYK